MRPSLPIAALFFACSLTPSPAVTQDSPPIPAFRRLPTQKAPGFDAAEARIKRKYEDTVANYRHDPKASRTPIVVSWSVDAPHTFDATMALPASGIVRTQEEFAAIWRAIELESPLPEIDFDQYCMCVAHGRGYRLELFHKMLAGGHIRLEFVDSALVKNYDSKVFAFLVPLNAAQSFNGVPLREPSNAQHITKP